MMNITLLLEQDVPGLADRLVEAYDLAQGTTWQRLAGIAERLGVAPLDAFVGTPDDSPDRSVDQRLALWANNWDEEAGGPEPPPRWFESAAGLESVRALLAHLKEHPRALRSGKRDLRAFEEVLRAAKEHQVRFHFYADI